MNITLKKYKSIDYSSGSALEFHHNVIYLIGDDSNKILCLNNGLDITSQIKLFDFDGDRIPKKDKPDFEACTILNNQLFIFGSGSKIPQRTLLYIFDIDTHQIAIKSLQSLYENMIATNDIQELNIEGITTINNSFLFFNRANNKQQNKLIILDDFNPNDLANTALKFVPIEIENFKGYQLGISGATYFPENDIMYLTASAEDTDNAYDDGEIVGSVLYIIHNASSVFLQDKIVLTNPIILEEIDVTLSKQKIESVCVLSYNEHSTDLILVADNDNGKSELFMISIDNEL
ncbi:MAG: hypothetical protein IPK18_02785 [Sphingobacteriales bacterium]|nr:MAG: hypothetical protein IPK18_02785 [Sphingobacteriales bacterium]